MAATSQLASGCRTGSLLIDISAGGSWCWKEKPGLGYPGYSRVIGYPWIYGCPCGAQHHIHALLGTCSLSEDDKRESQNEAGRDPLVGEGCLLQLQPQPSPAAANAGDPEGKAQADPLVPDPSAPKDVSLEPALPAPMPPEEIMALIQELQAAHEFQSSHFQERRQDLRSCHDCLKSMKILREHLQAVKTRLWHVETMLGIQVPPQELDPEEEQEEPSTRGGAPCDPNLPPAPPLSNGGA
ncbi:uncharacterized protein LOC113424337 [Notechis scutatus]|uniref:Uncharacterized protein LOC113424337 n=1 Tax=Notechis scutatus TaxID=8663 RepID=A0A6J1VP74_9SAUR|nr:uncharacterized protein LOC113424337 [Notechis scutatus]